MRRLPVVAAAVATALCASAGAAVAAAPSGGQDRQQVLVGFRERPGAAELALLRGHGAQVRHEFPAESVVAVTVGAAGVGALARDGRVLYVEPDAPRQAFDLSRAELAPAPDNGLYGLLAVGAPRAHSVGVTGTGVTACVADTSLDTGHPDIADQYAGGIDAVGGLKPGSSPDADNETHGTHVAGTLLGAKNTVGVFGVAPAARLKFARVLGPDGGSASDIMAGVQWLHGQGCQVVNLSLGGGQSTRTEKLFYTRMRSEGLLVVASSGNDSARRISYPAAYKENISVGAVDAQANHAAFSNTGRGLDVSAPGVGVLSSVRRGHGSDASVTAGATAHSALGLEFAGHTDGVEAGLADCGLGTAADVAGCQPAGKVALIRRGDFAFSEKVTNAMNGGAVAAIIYNNAAGNFVGTLETATSADGRAWIPAVSVSDTDGAALRAQAGQQATATVVNKASDWDHYDGTSMAAPHTSGVLALILQRERLLAKTKANADRAEAILKQTARDLGPRGYDTTFGYGLVQAG